MNSNFKYKYLLYKLISRFNFTFHKNINGLRVLMYHSVGDDVEDDIHDIYNISPKLFEAHINEIKENNLIALNEKEINQFSSACALTFDDGFANNLYTAERILSLFQIPFSVFVTANNVKNNKTGFLNKKELYDLSQKNNVIIGSHSLNHINLANCEKTQLKKELYESKAFIEDVTGKLVDSISYPNGSVNKLVRDCAEEAGYKIGFTSRSNINYKNRDKLLLMRTAIWSRDNVTALREKMYGKWDWMRYRYKDPAQE